MTTPDTNPNSSKSSSGIDRDFSKCTIVTNVVLKGFTPNIDHEDCVGNTSYYMKPIKQKNMYCCFEQIMKDNEN